VFVTSTKLLFLVLYIGYISLRSDELRFKSIVENNRTRLSMLINLNRSWGRTFVVFVCKYVMLLGHAVPQ
jgi:hypothetical protein